MLEAAVIEIRDELKAIRIELARMDGKLSNMPTTFQIVFILATFAITTFLGATGLSLAIPKFGH